MATRNRIGKQTELSLLPGSIVVTDASNEQFYLPPSLTNGQVLTTVLGVPAWAAPASEYENYAAVANFPLVGVVDTIYIATLENKVFYWNGITLAYVEVPTAGSSFTVNGTGVGTVAQTISAGNTLTVQGATNSGIVTLGVATDILEISLNEAKESFSPIATATTVTTAQIPIAATLDVYRNGLLQRVTTDYTLAGAVIVFMVAFGASGGGAGGEVVDVKYRYA